jgi:hypothetical protein
MTADTIRNAAAFLTPLWPVIPLPVRDHLGCAMVEWSPMRVTTDVEAIDGTPARRNRRGGRRGTLTNNIPKKEKDSE